MNKTKEQLQQEYTRACLELGNLVYQNDTMARQTEKNDKEIEKLQRSMRDLSLEASKIVDVPAAAVEATNE